MFAASFDFRERPDRKTVGTQIRAALTGQPSRLGRRVRGDPLAPRDHPNRGPPLKRERLQSTKGSRPQRGRRARLRFRRRYDGSDIRCRLAGRDERERPATCGTPKSVVQRQQRWLARAPDRFTAVQVHQTQLSGESQVVIASAASSSFDLKLRGFRPMVSVKEPSRVVEYARIACRDALPPSPPRPLPSPAPYRHRQFTARERSMPRLSFVVASPLIDCSSVRCCSGAV